MGHYKSNVRDLEFNLFEVFNRQEILGKGIYEDLDEEAARDMLHQIKELAEGPLADSFVEADRQPPKFDPETNTVVIPAAFKKSYKAFLDSEVWRIDIPTEIGGIAAPMSLRWALLEMILGANPAIHLYGSSFAMGQVLYRLGNADQKTMAAYLAEKNWGATMVLTEPDAGSDVGSGRTKAVQQPDGTWHITGVKRFITSAESDWPVPRAPAQAPRGSRSLSYRNTTSTSPPVSSASATVPMSPMSRTRWASRSRRPARSASARSTQPSAPCSATSTTASPRCSTSSRAPG